MAAERIIEIDALLWQGVVIEITFEENWLHQPRSPERAVAHLTVTTVTPKRTPLPITETGYRSHFLHPSEVTEAGGAVAYVRAWLDDMAQSREWKTYEQASRQLSLF